MLRGRQRQEVDLPQDTDLDVWLIGTSIEDHFDCEPREGLADPDSREAARIAVAALRRNGRLSPTSEDIITFKRPTGWVNGPWFHDVSPKDPNVAIVRDALRKSTNVWAVQAEEVAITSIAGLARNGRLELAE